MASEVNDGYCCLFCYRVFDKNSGHLEDISNVKKTQANFFRIVQRYCLDGNIKPNWINPFDMSNKKTKKAILPCSNCVGILQSFCQFYEEMKGLELKLGWKLWSLANIIRGSENLKARTKEFRKKLKEKGATDSGLMDKVRTFRGEFRQRALQRINSSVPRVTVTRCDLKTSSPRAEKRLDKAVSKSKRKRRRHSEEKESDSEETDIMAGSSMCQVARLMMEKLNAPDPEPATAKEEGKVSSDNHEESASQPKPAKVTETEEISIQPPSTPSSCDDQNDADKGIGNVVLDAEKNVAQSNSLSPSQTSTLDEEKCEDAMEIVQEEVTEENAIQLGENEKAIATAADVSSIDKDFSPFEAETKDTNSNMEWESTLDENKSPVGNNHFMKIPELGQEVTLLPSGEPELELPSKNISKSSESEENGLYIPIEVVGNNGDLNMNSSEGESYTEKVLKDASSNQNPSNINEQSSEGKSLGTVADTMRNIVHGWFTN